MNPIKFMTEISRKEFEETLYTKFGLKLDLDSICKYTDTYAENQKYYRKKHPKVFTIDFIDSTGKGWANIHGDFYRKHTKPKTPLFKEFIEYVEGHTYKIGGHYAI